MPPTSLRPVLLLLALFFLVPPTRAQQGAPRQGAPSPGGTVAGLVLDDATGEPIASSTIAVWHTGDSTLVTGAITEQDGRFRIEGLRPGDYYLKVSFVGFVTQRVDDVSIRPAAPAVEVGTIRLRMDTALMDEVQVEAERPFMEVGIDRTVYNTKDQIVSAGGSATDVLKNIPSVEVDIDGRVSLRGNQNVAILVNGRPTAMTGEALTSFLEGLPASSVERVEVIPNPSARYEPDGMSGILNIVLKQNQDLGLGGSVTAGASTQAAYNASGTVNYQRGNWTTLTSYSFRRDHRQNDGLRFRENRYADPLTFLSIDNEAERYGLSHVLNASVDRRFGQYSTLSGSALVSLRDGDNTALFLYSLLDAGRAEAGRFDRRQEGDRGDAGMDYRLTFRRAKDPGRNELTAEARFEVEDERSENAYAQQLLSGEGSAVEGSAVDVPTSERTRLDEDSREGSLQLDYVRPVGALKVEAGYKGSLRQLDNRYHSRADLGDGSERVVESAFAYDEQIHAAYGIASREAGRFGAQVGVRLEGALTTFDLVRLGEAYDNDYFSAFPSVFLSYKLSEDPAESRQVKLSYSKRINRPNTWQLNPIRENEDPLFRFAGNPYLKPEYVHAFELSYTQLLGKTSVTLSPYYRHTVDVIRFYPHLTPEGVTEVTFRNYDTSSSWGTELIGSLRLGSRLNAFANFNAYRVVTDGSNVDTDLTNDAFGWSARGNASVQLQEGLDLQLTYFYRAPMKVEGGRMGAFSMTDLALRKQLLEKKANLSLRVSDPFARAGFHAWREDELFVQEFRQRWNARQLALSFSYNFGQQLRKRNRPEMDGPEGGGGFEGMGM